MFYATDKYGAIFLNCAISYVFVKSKFLEKKNKNLVKKTENNRNLSQAYADSLLDHPTKNFNFYNNFIILFMNSIKNICEATASRGYQLCVARLLSIVQEYLANHN